MLDHRYVYINEQTSYKGEGRRIKIGVAVKVKRRNVQTSKGLPGRWGNLTSKRLLFARTTESFLHKKYQSFHTPLENLLPGSGGSEIFTISSHQLAILRLTLGAMVAADIFISFTIMAAFSKLLFALCFFLY